MARRQAAATIEANNCAERLEQEKALILRIWESRVREELPAAKQHGSLALLNSLPKFLSHMVDALSSESFQRKAEENLAESAQEHAENRADLVSYTLDQVLLEYRVLREVVFAVLESTHELHPTKRDVIIDSFHTAMTSAASEFFRIKLFREQIEQLKAESYARSLRDLQEVTETAIAKSGNFNDLLQALLQRIRAIFHCDTVAIYLLSDDGKELVARASHGFEDDVKAGFRIPLDAGVPGAVLRNGKAPLIIEDLPNSGIRVVSEGLRKSGVRSMLGVRLVADSQMIGVIHIGSVAKRDFEPSEIRLFDLISSRIAVAILNSRLYEKSKEELTRFKTDNALRARILSLIAHDIRNPLSAAQLSAQLMTKQKDKPEVVRKLSERVADNIKRADNLVKDLLDVNRTLSGRQISLEIKECDLVPVIASAISSLTSSEGECFMFVPPEKPVVGFWSPNEIQRVLEHLLRTSLQWNREGSPVLVTLKPRESEVIIEIQTNRTGLRGEKMKTVAELLRTNAFDVGNRERKNGSLGLILAEGVISTHGGNIKIFSQGDQGMLFVVTIPRDSRPFLK